MLSYAKRTRGYAGRGDVDDPDGGTTKKKLRMWTCDTCTFDNRGSNKTCAMCESPRSHGGGNDSVSIPVTVVSSHLDGLSPTLAVATKEEDNTSRVFIESTTIQVPISCKQEPEDDFDDSLGGVLPDSINLKATPIPSGICKKEPKVDLDDVEASGDSAVPDFPISPNSKNVKIDPDYELVRQRKEIFMEKYINRCLLKRAQQSGKVRDQL